jgi:hypothetical protein
MRSKYTKVLVALVAVFALGAVASSAALAATPEWQFGGKAIKTALKVEGRWSGETGSTALKLTDPKLKEVFTCETDSLNSISAKTVETTSVEWESCKISSGGECEPNHQPEEVPTGLPWKAELYEEGGKLRERIKGSGGKAVGWSFVCRHAGLFVGNECTATELTAGLSNVTNGVDAAFDSLTPKLTCRTARSEEKGESGTLEGTELLEDTGLTVVL